jgi:pyridoxine 4-dehydrogenase
MILAARAGHWKLAGELLVTRMGFGVAQLSRHGERFDRDDAVRVLRHAVDLGVTHIDTTGYYGNQETNSLIRQALYPYLDDLVIATKVGVVADPERGWRAGATPSELRDQVEVNLRRLGRDHLDMVYLRVSGDPLFAGAPTSVQFADSFAALAELRAAGLVRHLGLSGVTPDQLAQARRIAPVVAVQNLFNVVDRTGEPLLRVCEQDAIAFVPYYPLAAGLLAEGSGTDRIEPVLRTLDEIAGQHDATRAQVALAWLLGRSRVTLAIPGTANLAHLVENVVAAGVRLTDSQIRELDALGASPRA